MKTFLGFRLDVVNQCLWRGGERVSLTPKAFDLLRYLVDHAERLVTQEEILEVLWADTFVNHEVIKKNILDIRKVLGDRPGTPQFIRTFPKRGYQFIAPVADERPTLVAKREEQEKRFVDRPAARARLDSALERAIHGQRQFVFVTGEPGIGKTTFVDLFTQAAGLLPDLWIARGQCVEGFGGQEAYYPLLTAIEQLLQASDDRRLVDVLARRAPTWLLQFPSLVKADQRETLRRETAGATRERMVREICETLEAITADRTLILVLEDLHWSDLSTLDVLSSCARRGAASRLLVIGTLRPAIGTVPSALSRLHLDLSIHNFCTDVQLDAFHPAEVSEYLGLSFGPVGFSSDLGGLLHRHSGGNPLFVSALVRDLLGKGAIVRDGDTWTLAVPVERLEPGVPSTLQDMLDVQFDQLTEQEQRVLRRASAIGDRFAAWLVADDAVEIEVVQDVCESLASRRLFIHGGGIGDLAGGTLSGFYQFHHSLYRQAVHGRLSEVARAKLHRSIGERLATLFGARTLAVAAELAVHFEKAHEYERAIAYLMLAAKNVERRFAVRDAIDVLQHAMALVSRVGSDRRAPLEIALLESIGEAHYVLGTMVESALAYETAVALAAKSGLRDAQVRAQSGFARPLRLLDPGRSIAVLGDAVEAAAGLAPAIQARTALLAAGMRLLYDAWRADDVHICESARSVADDRDWSAPAFERMIYTHVQLFKGECRSALERAEAATPRQHETVDVAAHLFALSAQILACIQLGRFGQALRIIQANQRMAEQHGSDPWLFSYREAWLRTMAMDFQGAQHVCAALTRSTVYPTGQAQTIGRLAAGLDALDRGRWHEARTHFEHILDPDRTPKFFLHWYWRVHAQVGLVHAWLHSAHLANARAEADRLIEIAAGVDDPHLQALAWDMAAQVAMTEGALGDARRCIDRAFAAFGRVDVPTCAWRVHTTAAELLRRIGDSPQAAIQRDRARAHISGLAESFAPDQPLRLIMLGSPSVRRACEDVDVTKT